MTSKLTYAFSRPAGGTGSYVANDVIANHATAGSVVVPSWSLAAGNAISGRVTKVRVAKSDQSVATPTIRVWFWDATFTPGAGDDAAFAMPIANSLGQVDVAVVNAGSDDAVGWTLCDVPFAGIQTLYGLLQSLSTFTGADGETFTTTLWIDP